MSDLKQFPSCGKSSWRGLIRKGEPAEPCREVSAPKSTEHCSWRKPSWQTASCLQFTGPEICAEVGMSESQVTPSIFLLGRSEMWKPRTCFKATNSLLKVTPALVYFSPPAMETTGRQNSGEMCARLKVGDRENEFCWNTINRMF